MEDIKMFRKEALIAAKDLLYGEKVIEQLKAAKTTAEISRIMKNARDKKFG
jgi:hypothetical protein